MLSNYLRWFNLKQGQPNEFGYASKKGMQLSVVF